MGRPLRKGQKALINELLPSLEIFLPNQEPLFSPFKLFSAPVQEVWLEIGFGAGEHLVKQALKYPSVGIIGCEPYINGVAQLLKSVAEKEISNIRVFRGDARLLLQSIAKNSISRCFILFPDPWPKTRHHKRRIIGPNTIPLFYKVMSTEAELRIATDVTSYKEWILEHILYSDTFDWRVKRANDWRVRPPDWPETRYEQKAKKAGRLCSYFLFKRRD
ncbi:MAG: tRNA (guanosine(46)-N7)-methyltransferase TrmB [Rhodospirillaceae bacterium]|nr:tRNA (guanosine(46)-N7)-methyltransferase TrmB [Rhodospirillaceae bacterium]|tara:strand:- start:156 stop:809 length:654 start_codon:yes stop_codon:yes gene_type:complete